MKRKLSVILALDMADAVAAVETPGEQAGLIEDLRRAAGDLIKRHEGRIFNASGSSILAEFGSSVEAVRCAIAIVSEAAHADSIRIGLMFGDVVETEGNLLGDAVNIAARLAAVAEPRSIVVSALIHDQVRAKIAVPSSPLQPLSLKNIAEPVAAVSYHPLDPHRRAVVNVTPAVTPHRHASTRTVVALGVVAAGAVMIAALWSRMVPTAPVAAVPATSASRPGAPPVAVSTDDRAKRLARCADILERVQSGIASADDRKALQACR